MNAFAYCSLLEEVDFASAPDIGMNAFMYCRAFKTLVIRDEVRNPPTLQASALNDTKIASGEGYIYVPDAKVTDYKNATNFATYASQIKPLSEYVEE